MYYSGYFSSLLLSSNFSQNGKSERKIRSFNNVIRTLLCHASLPPYFWPHALNIATYLLNILQSKLFGNLTPTHLLYHKSPSYTHLRVFGCFYSPLIPSFKIHKLQPHSSLCVFWGYPCSHLTKLFYLVISFLTKPLSPFLNLLIILLTSTLS